jgi:hypothetical protein
MIKMCFIHSRTYKLIVLLNGLAKLMGRAGGGFDREVSGTLKRFLEFSGSSWDCQEAPGILHRFSV